VSDPRPAGTAPTGARYADELNALLTAAGVPGPYVLVGPSYGGLVAAAYAVRYASRTAGLVFVDSDAPCTCTFDLPERGDFDLAAASFGSIPSLVIAAEWGSEGDGRDLARRSTNSMLVTALQTTHTVIAERPDLVTEAVRLVAASVRNGGVLAPCATSALPAAGGRCETVG
jgi:pimeloyl-ACP methyl ester carboxylesterase